MTYKKIVYSEEKCIASIILNSPQNLNAIDEEMVDEIMEVLKQIDESEEIKVLVISGDGKGFSAGGDIRMMIQSIQTNNLSALDGGIKKVGLLSMAIKKMSKPVIASVHGAVAGAGFNVALACDFIIASHDAKFIQSFVNIGLVPDAGGIFLLTRAVGVNRANEMIMLGQPIDAEAGKVLGFVHMTVPCDILQVETTKFAEKLSRGPSISYKMMKKLVFESEFKDFEQFINLEEKIQKACGRTDDFKEGIMSFIEKRKPIFLGK
ncbi:MAG TPA: enoyl-CoA hydratase [Clostridiales bacterium]|jgi:enoyl-CoA hydratase/carnithine racemase|nr:enoyl-CoA hydratase [Clostridiales bacterium]